MEQPISPNPELREDHPEAFKRDGRHARRGERYTGARVSVYWCCMVLLNALLAIFALYVLAYALQMDWRFLSVATVETIAKAVFQLLLIFSPVILSILLNRLLYRIVRGRRRFPWGTGFFAVIAALAIQALVIFLLVRSGSVEGLDAIRIHSLTNLNS